MRIARMALWVAISLVAGLPQAVGQEIVAELKLDKREPRPIEFAFTKPDGGLVTIANPSRRSSRTLSIFKYDAQFQRAWEKPLLELTDRITFEGLHVLGADILVFYTEYAPRERTITLYLNRYKLDGTEVFIRKEVVASTNERKQRQLFVFTRSIDRKRLVALGQLDPPNNDRRLEKREVTLTYLTYEASTTVEKQGTATLTYINEEFDWRQTVIANDGTFWLLGRIVPNGQERRTLAYEYTLLKVDPSRNLQTEIKLDFGGRNVTDLLLKMDRAGNAIAAGFYSNERNDQLVGILYARVDESNNELVVSNYTRFTPEFMVNFTTEGKVRRGRELSDLYLDDIVLRADGGALLLAEEFYVTATNYTNGLAPGVGQGFYPYGYNPYNPYFDPFDPTWNMARQYYYGDIAAISVSPDGRIEWSSVVPKSQTSTQNRELSYFPFIVADRALFFYKGTEAGTGANVFKVEMDYAGRSDSPKPFFQRFRGGDEFYTSYSEQISNREAILVYYIARERTFTIAKLRYGY